MKALYIPSALLVVLLLFSLWTSAYVQNQTSQWLTTIHETSAFLDNEQWDKVETQLLAAHENWNHSQTLFHTILDHQALDETEKYFAGALAACREQDSVELRIHLAQLSTQLSFLAETQAVSLGNIL